MRLVAGLRPDPLGSLQRSPNPLAELKGREWETGGGRKGRGDGRGSEGEKERSLDPHCMKCVDAHADLPIIKQLPVGLLPFKHSGALCTGVPERQRLIKNSKRMVMCLYPTSFDYLMHAAELKAETGNV